MKTSLKAALFFGVAPLVTGIGIFLAWVLSRADWLMAAGVVTIYVGMCSVAVGAGCLGFYLRRSWRSQAVPRRRLVWQTVAVLALFLVNFVAAGAAVLGAMVIESKYTVAVTNQSAEPFRSARIEGGGVAIELGVIAPGKTIKRSFWIEQDGELVLRAKQGTAELEATIDGYVTNSLGGNKVVVLEADGTVNVRDRHPRSLD